MCQEKLNMVDESTVKSVGALGGGIAASGGTCGILLGGVAMISSIYSRGRLDEKENPRMWPVSGTFMEAFGELTRPYGSMDCRDIARVDWHDRLAVKEYYANPLSRRRICIKLIGETALILGDILEHEIANGHLGR